ncbi:FMN-binding domain-containing protein [Pochonia chlamydosporia 170]|uniref:FMN-binding domain-containing protein n=1 Tax=Pochonia chlamydosporia 170 TaxID=1380566 RepID=A0A179FAD2_METCM|nr:FMN-binding domain-containing protein [Pochonia chlamydosporia 170]OAQ62424.1 FMN-binding domain-containing protein [Pochonia chlamydosporia 170]
MHLRKDHAETNIHALQQFIKANPLGVLTTSIASPTCSFPTLQATHIPFILDVDNDTASNKLGRLRGHMARDNPQAKALIEALSQSTSNTLDQQVLIVFTSPIHHYITTNFYSETMSTNKRTAPTWNYSAAQVYGRAKVHWDSKKAETSAFLIQQLSDLASLGEKDIMGFNGEDASPQPWKVEDAPASYVERSLKGIIGLEIDIVTLEGKVKMSQELKEADRDGVVEGLRKYGGETATRMADLVHERGLMKITNRA